MKGRSVWLHAFLASGGCVAIFCLRRGWERPFFALADGLSVSGFFGLLFVLAPRLVRSESFDGFSYAARWAATGLFPQYARSYAEYKKERGERRQEEKRSAAPCLTYAVFLAAGILLSLFFL